MASVNVDRSPSRVEASATLAREVRRLAIPAILTSLLQTLVFVVDRVMLGHHAKTSLAAMQIAGPVEWSTLSVLLAFEVGTVAHVGRLVGANEPVRARNAALVSLAVSAALGAVVAIVLSPALLAALPYAFGKASPEAVGAAHAYLAVTLGASPVIFIAAAATALLQASGDTRTPLAIGTFANLVHVGMNRVLILGAFGLPALGPRGCAISTAVTFALQAALAVGVLWWGGGRLTLRRAAGTPGGTPAWNGVEARALLAISWPAALERLLYHIGFLGYVWVIGRLGDDAMAANQALISIESVCFLSADGFGIAAAALVAQKLGAGRADQAADVARIACRYAMVLLGTLGIGFFLARRLVVPVFTDDPVVAEQGIAVMWVLALAQVPMAASIVLAQALRGAGRTRNVLAITSFGALFVRLSCTYGFALGAGLGLVGVWLGSTCDWLVRTALLGPTATRTIARS